MPAYITSPLDGVPPMLLPGEVGYSLGSRNNDQPAAKMLVTSVAISSNVATVGVQMVEGNIPAVGSLISIRGTQTPTSGGAPNFNVSNVALTGVTITASTGVGTVTFALTSSNISTTADAGFASVPVPETADAMVNKTGLQLTLQAEGGFPSNSRDVTWSISTPSAPVSFTAALQGADIDVDSEYVQLDSMTSATEQTVLGVRQNFLRIKLTGVSGGTNPTVIGRILV